MLPARARAWAGGVREVDRLVWPGSVLTLVVSVWGGKAAVVGVVLPSAAGAPRSDPMVRN